MRNVDSSTLAFSLSSHRPSFISLIFISRFLVPSTGGASGITGRTRRATGYTELTNDPTPVVVSSPRIPDTVLSAQTSSNSQGISQDSQAVSEDIFANIQYVQGDFVHHPVRNGATPRDCRIQRTSLNGESYKEFTKCLTLILTVAKSYPVKTLQRERLTFVAKQLSFFIFPPTRDGFPNL